ncbi:MAG: iron-containing alcohol dehydrogenase [Oscillospiraceae bacterium]|nr:iron-containing alcohol dehydrogenase [Oscillospiraceae bacterium]
MESIFNSPNPILFGIGAAARTGLELQKLGCKKVLAVFDKGVEQAGVAEKVLKAIRDAGIEIVVYNNVQADPPVWSVEEAGALGVKEGIDGVVGIGGGSSLDTAKGAKMLQTNPPPLRQYFGRTGVVTKPSVPLIVIPTTAGTGSECTPGGTITDTEQNIKTNISGVGCAVSLGIVDPELSAGLPKSVTASTGLDALCHCVESYTSAMANSISTVLGREGIRLVGQYLVRACNNGAADMEARAGMAKAATLGGMAMSGAFCHLCHDIGRSLGAKFHVPHGNGCAITLPQVLQIIAPVKTEEVRYIARCLGAELSPDADAAAVGKAAYDAAHKLLKDTGLKNLKELGLRREELLAVVPDEVVMQIEMEIKAFGGIAPPPLPVTKELVAEIINRAYDEN